jgi:septum formation protein
LYFIVNPKIKLLLQEIVLASNSPRRKHLLELAELTFEVVSKSIEEIYPSGLNTLEIPVFIAREKALAVKTKLQVAYHSQYAGKAILAADTIVVLEDQLIGKPKDRADAIKILTALSGRSHQVITGVVILQGDREISFSEITEVEFYPLSSAQIEYYVDEYKPYDKAGAYAIQEWIGVIGIKSIHGDFYNVMGLPVSRVLQALNNLKELL